MHDCEKSKSNIVALRFVVLISLYTFHFAKFPFEERIGFAICGERRSQSFIYGASRILASHHGFGVAPSPPVRLYKLCNNH